MRFARAGQCSMVGGEGRSSCRTQIRRFRFMADTPVASELVGAVWPAAHPGEDPLLYGHVELQPKGAFEARSVQTFRLVYTVGRSGIDDTGGKTGSASCRANVCPYVYFSVAARSYNKN